MGLAIRHDEIPLETTADGLVVITGTRVSLDLIVEAFTGGATAEEISHQFPTVPLADVYAAITYYLRHRDEVDGYVEQRRHARARTRAECERRLDPQGIRDRLVARRSSAS
jgi:uncharacterized protein (DUF433 family)